MAKFFKIVIGLFVGFGILGLMGSMSFPMFLFCAVVGFVGWKVWNKKKTVCNWAFCNEPVVGSILTERVCGHDHYEVPSCHQHLLSIGPRAKTMAPCGNCGQVSFAHSQIQRVSDIDFS